MAKQRISNRTAEALACSPLKDREFVWDDMLTGFGIAVFPSGKRVYVVQYRQNGRSRRISLGEHGRLTPAEARVAAKKVLGAVANGADPIAQRVTERRVPTFAEVASSYMTKHVARHRKARTASGYETLLSRYILPAVGTMRITDICRADLEALHVAMAPTPGAANRALAVFSAVWSWAAKEQGAGLKLTMSPAKGIHRNREEGRERYLSTEELGRLGDALRRAESVGLAYFVDESGPKAKHAAKPENRFRRLDPFAIAAIRLLLFTGARLREILHARWDEIDFERGLLNLSSARSKTGKKAIFLNAAALQVLAALPRMDGNPHVIPGEARDASGSGLPRYDLKMPWRAITKDSKLEGLRIHDLRHSHAATGAGLGLGLHMVGRLLGHMQPATTARYAHLDADPIRRASDRIGTSIFAALQSGRSANESASSGRQSPPMHRVQLGNG